jgi:hypothetical protein
MNRVNAAAVGDAANSDGGSLIRDLANDLRELAAPITRSEKMSVAIERAARLSGLEPWRAFNIWYGKAKRVETAERQAVKAALAKKQREAARNEFHELKIRLAILESRLNQIDPDFHSPTLDAAREQMRGLGGVDRAGNRGR